jgi:hypothetical protein
MRENGLAPDHIDHIELIVPPWADRIAPFRNPVSGEQAKFSIRQGVTGLLVGDIPELPYTHALARVSAPWNRASSFCVGVTALTWGTAGGFVVAELTTGHLRRLDGTELSASTVSAITDAVLEDHARVQVGGPLAAPARPPDPAHRLRAGIQLVNAQRHRGLPGPGGPRH